MTLLQSLTAPGLAAIVAKATLLLGLGWCGASALTRWTAGVRHSIWLTVIVGVMLVPVVARIAPVNVPVLPFAPALARTSGLGTPGGRGIEALVPSDAARAADVGVLTRATSRALIHDPDTVRLSLPTVALVAWMTIALLLVVRLIAGMRSVARIKRRAHVLHSAEWTDVFDDAVRRLHLAAPTSLVMSDQVEMAFACDAFAPTIVVPASAAEWSLDRRRAVLLHELAHVRRRDLIGHTIAGFACAIYWFNPLMWIASRRLRLESELASDDIVLASGVRPSEYAQHLLDMVTAAGAGVPAVALAMARPTDFEGRLVAILDRAKRRRTLGKRQGAAIIGLVGVLTLSIAAAVPVPRTLTAPEPSAGDAGVGASPASHGSPGDSAWRESVSWRTSPTTSAGKPAAATPRIATSPSATSRMATSPAATVAAPSPSPASPPASATTSSRAAAAPLSPIAISLLLRYGAAGIINPMMMILRGADSLGLTGRQADSIATLNRRYMVRLNSVWAPVSGYYVAHPITEDARRQSDAIRLAPRASMDALIELVPAINDLLTPEQRAKLPPTIAGYLDIKRLDAIGGGQAAAPAGVFLLDGGFGGRGARGGGRVGR